MSPEFLNTPYKFSLYENTEPNSSSIGDISVRDEDGDSVTVTIQGDNTGNFYVHASYNFSQHMTESTVMPTSTDQSIHFQQSDPSLYTYN